MVADISVGLPCTLFVENEFEEDEGSDYLIERTHTCRHVEVRHQLVIDLIGVEIL